MKNININRIEAIREFLKEKVGSKYAVLGISSGIDSSLVLTLLATAIDPDKIKAIFMPDSICSLCWKTASWREKILI